MKQYGSDTDLDFVTSARVEVVGGHEKLSLWVQHAFVGTLTMGLGQSADFLWMLGLKEQQAQESEPPGPISWAPHRLPSPFNELALAVQLAERPAIKQWQWRCEHGEVLRDHTGVMYTPACGCTAPSLRDAAGVLASQLHIDLAAAGVLGEHSAACAVCPVIAMFLRRAEVR